MTTRNSLAFLIPLILCGADWDRFRGPNGTGISSEKSIPVNWAPENILFKTPLPGEGHSSPIVIGKRVFVLSATSTARLVLCLDASTGKIVWQQSVPGKVGKTHRKSSLASATPCSDGDRVYCSFWDGNRVSLHAYTVEGKPVWHRDLGPFRSQHGPGFSPIVVDGKVILNNDQDGQAVLLAFDAKTGKPLWHKERTPFRACYSTPILNEQGSAGKELLVTSSAGIAAYDPATGTETWHLDWRFPAKPLRTVGSSVIADGVIVGCSGDGAGDRHMIGVKLGGKGNVTKTNLLWNKDAGTPYVPTLVARGSHLYGVNDNGNAVCFEAKSGKECWQHRMAGTVSASPVMIDDKLYVIDEKGSVFVVAADPASYKLLAKNSIGEPVLSSPAVAGGRLYLRGEKHLFCIGTPGISPK